MWRALRTRDDLLIAFRIGHEHRQAAPQCRGQLLDRDNRHISLTVFDHGYEITGHTRLGRQLFLRQTGSLAHFPQPFAESRLDIVCQNLNPRYHTTINHLTASVARRMLRFLPTIRDVIVGAVHRGGSGRQRPNSNRVEDEGHRDSSVFRFRTCSSTSRAD